MKLFFLNHDTLYKLFTTIEKVQKGSTIHIFIESENQFFRNSRRAKQIKQLLEERNIRGIFMTESPSQKKYFELNQLEYEFKKKQVRSQMIQLLYWFFFNIKKFHLYIHQKRNYASFAVFGAEIIFLCMIIYFLYSLILPKTVITIHPSYQINEIAYNFRYISPENIINYPYKESHIIIPLLKESAAVNKILSIDGEKVQFSSQPAKGKVRIVNTTQNIITLVKNTQLITDEGVIFLTNREVSLPRSTGSGQAGHAYVEVISKSHDDNRKIIGTRGNIAQDTKLIIKNLKQSKYTREVYAEATEPFNGGSIIKSGSLVQSDIGLLQKKLYETIAKDKYGQSKKNIPSDGDKILLPFENLFTISGCIYRGISDVRTVQTGNTLSGSLTCMIEYPYITKKDIQKAIEQYVVQRPSSVHNLISINDDSISFDQIISGQYNSFIIPTKINVIQGYDFKKDINGVSNSLIDQVIGLPKDKAKNLILSYPEISNVNIKISPPRYKVVSNLKSRIFIKINYDDPKR